MESGGSLARPGQGSAGWGGRVAGAVWGGGGNEFDPAAIFCCAANACSTTQYIYRIQGIETR